MGKQRICLTLILLLFTASNCFGFGALLGSSAVVSSTTDYTTQVISYWMMEQASGATALDGSANDNDLTANSDASGPTQSTDHVEGSYSSSFVASSYETYSRADSSLSTGFPGKQTGGSSDDFTLGCRVKLSSGAAVQLAGKKSSGDEWAYLLYFDGTNFKFRVSSNGWSETAVVGTTAPSVDGSDWYSVAGVFDSVNDEIRLYVDGAEDATPVAWTLSLFASPDSFVVGGFSTLNVDEVWIDDSVFSASAISDIHTNGLEGSL